MPELTSPLNSTQLEILKLFSQPLSEEDLKDIKSVLVKHLAEKLVKKVDKIVELKNYQEEDFNKWLNDPAQ